MAEIVLRGIAAPYDVAAAIGNGVTELIQPGAFSEQCEYELDCSVKLDSHDHTSPDIASTADATLVLFEGPSGLMFEAHILADIANFGSVCWEINNRKYDRCSVNFSVRDVDVDADDVEHVTRAQISHVCLTADAAYGGHTAVWIANRPLDTSNDRIVMMAERWSQAYAEYRSAKGGRPSNRVHPGRQFSSLPTKRPALSAEALDREQHLQMQLREYPGGNPHRGLGLVNGPASLRDHSKQRDANKHFKWTNGLLASLFEVLQQDKESLLNHRDEIRNLKARVAELEGKL